jgi:hypothetical protein
MIKRVTIGDVRITLTIARIVKVGGFNSLLTDGDHILMWDFDDTAFDEVHDHLLMIQDLYELPKIYILETKKNTNFIAYCFRRTPWHKAVRIIAETKGIDWNFFKYGVFRDKFTLRVTDKGQGKPHKVAVLDSDVPEDVSIWELKTWVNYETLKPK